MAGTKEVIPAHKDDQDFIKYLESDLIQIQKEIDAKEKIKARILENLRLL